MADGTTVHLKFQEAWEEPGGVVVADFQQQVDFDWQAGQSIRLDLPGPTGTNRRGVRTFTITTTPEEHQFHVATLVERPGEPSPFKTAFADLSPGDEVDAALPTGGFEEGDPGADDTHVLVALGFGATAIRGFARHLVSVRPDLRVRIVQTPIRDGLPFEDDFRHFVGENDALDYQQKPGGFTTPADVEDAARVPLARARFYLAGTHGEVDALRHLLNEAGVAAERVQVQTFTGH